MGENNYTAAVEALTPQKFGALKHFKDQYAQQALTDLPPGYEFEHDDLPDFKKKSQVTGSDILQYVKDQTDNWDSLPSSHAYAHMLSALNDIDAVEEGGRHKNTQKYDVREYDPDDTPLIVSAIDNRIEEKDDRDPAGKRLLSYIENMFDNRFTPEELEEKLPPEEDDIIVGSTLSGLVIGDYLAYDGQSYRLKTESSS